MFNSHPRSSIQTLRSYLAKLSRLQLILHLAAVVFVLLLGSFYLSNDSWYHESHVAFSNSKGATSTNGLRYAIFIPTFTGHFPVLRNLFQSLKCLCTDLDQVDIYVIVSDSNEAKAWSAIADTLDNCNQTFSRFETPTGNVGRPNPKYNLVNLYDILPPTFMNSSTVHKHDTSAILEEHGKYAYQSIKKLAAAIHFDYDYALWLDSEAIAVQPFGMRKVFDDFIGNPTIWRSRMTNTDDMRNFMHNSASLLGRSVDSFGSLSWYLESVEWIIEKAVIKDLVSSIEDIHGAGFWQSWLHEGAPFEVLFYNMHIHTKKAETVNPIYSKYMILETEVEMTKLGMAPAFKHMERLTGTGFLERGFNMLADAEIQPNFTAFLRRYSMEILRLEDLNIAPPEVMDRFLLETPIYLLACGAPALHQWWSER